MNVRHLSVAAIVLVGALLSTLDTSAVTRSGLCATRFSGPTWTHPTNFFTSFVAALHEKALPNVLTSYLLPETPVDRRTFLRTARRATRAKHSLTSKGRRSAAAV
jgi:hypothetical protein